ncbi:CinA family nicotinamide mononucleotide deamidase-related protein [Aquimarina intermedia]|uniref:CinA-like protein n=1 Tax=Aquimarina intermedia TaxID=350814 RepID=A0A5S5BYU5_9FLAO|nr:CinA family nicotinamide mononucleotide deamidase-related protein [Aquimarina intermedia]TYP70843.1 nicotinamide-nucleotide amidase [Aquimarina intermedia]
MLAEIITIGDEILIGQIVDSNSAFIGKALNKIGVDVYQISSIQDDRTHILAALKEAQARVDIVLITGGLGPTKDDITRHTLCEFFDDVLVENSDVLLHVEQLFEKYISTPISDINRQQALVPSKAQVLKNKYGTAPGMWIEENDTVFISMPGVPFEMKGLIENEVVPRLKSRFKRPFILHKTVLTHGVGESAIAEKIASWEEELPSFVKLAYLPSLGRVRLRLSARGKEHAMLETEIERRLISLHALIGDIIVGYEDDQPIEVVVGSLLAKQHKTLALAESCTGGHIAQAITAHAGVSSFFKGGVVTYATISKTTLLGIPEDFIATYSVTSSEVAEAMAKAARQKFNADYAIATTGNAGPEKGDGDVAVGTVFIAMATPEKTYSQKFVFGNLRERTIGKAVSKAFEMLHSELKDA